MRVPQDISLRKFIESLIAADKVEQFYYTEDWKELRAEVLEYFHNECQECLKRGEYTRADCVHHVNEVRDRPDLALSRYYVDGRGIRQYNLIPLCNTCHNIVHDKLNTFYKKEKFTNKERW